MTGAKSRWADDSADKKARAAEKEAKKRAKAEKLRLQEEAAKERAQEERPVKRRRLSNPQEEKGSLLRLQTAGWSPVRNVDNFERLNHIEEGSYGWVSRAKDFVSGEVVALKKLKMGLSREEGFPVEAAREIKALQRTRHRHVVELREVVMGGGDVYLVMEFMEHDLRNLQAEMVEPFTPSETKTLMVQIVSGVEYLHENWIIHRDLKTSNILMNNLGIIKLADFGMARQFSYPPPPKLTQLVVTLWYRAPELLLGTTTYDMAIDIWSVGCILGELVRKDPLLQGRNEADQLSRIFELVGMPDESTWPGFRRLPNAKVLRLPSRGGRGKLRSQFPLLTGAGADLLSLLLSLNPDTRPTASDILSHPYFAEAPRPKPTAMFPTFPSKAGGERRRKMVSPKAPRRGEAPRIDMAEFSSLFSGKESEEVGGGFALKLA